MNRLTNTLKKINSIDTNLVIELPTKNIFFIRLVKEINRLIKINKKSHRELNETQRQFDMAINNISHDIRTPLTVASGYTQLLVKQTEGDSDHLVKKVASNLTEVEKKLDALLTYNRLIEERIEVNLETVNVTSVLESKVIDFYDAFKKKSMNLELSIEKEVQMITDKDILIRIIENALGNMLNHGVESGKVKLTQHQKTIRMIFSNKTEQKILNYDKLFDRFYTEDLSRVNKNSGLGLYIIKELSALTNGEATASGDDGYFELIVTLQHK